MPKSSVRVEFDLSEIQKAIESVAVMHLDGKAPTGGVRIIFDYEPNGTIAGAVVEFNGVGGKIKTARV